MVRFIMSMISQRRFHVHTGGKKSRCRTLINGVPQGSVTAPLLFNLYTHDIPPTTSEKYIYADDIAFKTCRKDFPEIEKVLREIWTFLVPILPTGDSSLTSRKLFCVCFILLIVELTTNLTFKSPVKGYLLKELRSILVSPLIAPYHPNNT